MQLVSGTDIKPVSVSSRVSGMQQLWNANQNAVRKVYQREGSSTAHANAKKEQCGMKWGEYAKNQDQLKNVKVQDAVVHVNTECRNS